MRKECRAESEKINYKHNEIKFFIKHFECCHCQSELIKPNLRTPLADIKFICLACNESMDYEDVIEAAVIKYYDSHDFEAIFDGCESSLSECPECLRETFIAEEGLCPVCEYELKYKNCKACKIPLSVDEQQYNGFCEQCFILDPADFEEDAH